MKNKIFELEGIHFRNKNTQMIFHIIRPKDRQKVKFRKIKKKRFFFFFCRSKQQQTWAKLKIGLNFFPFVFKIITPDYETARWEMKENKPKNENPKH